MKKLVLLIVMVGFLSCERQNGLPQDGLSDDKLLSIAYDRYYLHPEGFYQDPTWPDAFYYVNTVSISPINQRDSRWIELSTNDRDEALKWVSLTIANSDDRITHLFIEESETKKHFEFKFKQITDNRFELPIRFRVHKTSYYHSIFDRFAPWNHVNETKYGYYNGEIEKSKVRECIEYLWVINTFANHGQKVLSSEIRETGNYFEVHIVSLGVSFGGRGLHDVVSLYDNYIRFNKDTRLITFRQSLRRQILGHYNPGF